MPSFSLNLVFNQGFSQELSQHKDQRARHYKYDSKALRNSVNVDTNHVMKIILAEDIEVLKDQEPMASAQEPDKS